MQHSLVGGSTCKMTINCQGSLNLRRQMPEQPENEYTIEGTLLHSAIDAFLSTDIKLDNLVGMTYKSATLTEDLLESKLKPALKLFDEIDPDGIMEFATEVKVSFGDIIPDVFGTTDVIGRIGKRAIVLDWKFGDPFRGVKVDAEESPQGLFYAAAARRTPGMEWAFDGAEELEIVIVQPPVISRWVTPISRIDTFEAELIEAVKRANNPEVQEYNHGDWCRWCTGKPVCPKMTGAVDRALKVKLDTIDTATINAYLKNADLLEGWITDLRALAFRMMEEGGIKLPDWKLVAKRATRKWADVAKAEAALIETGIVPYAPKELLSPAQAEKALKKVKKELPADLVVSVSSGSTLAPKDDPRPEVLQIGQQLNAALSKLV